MTTKDEALRKALEALNHYEKAGLATIKTIDAITAIKEVLAQPPEHHQFPMKRPDEDRIKGWNDALEHASSRFENEFKQAFGDTASSFAVWLKGLKR